MIADYCDVRLWLDLSQWLKERTPAPVTLELGGGKVADELDLVVTFYSWR
jgi:hypothetical protein